MGLNQSAGRKLSLCAAVVWAAWINTAGPVTGARAADIFYNGGGGNFSNGASWVGGVAPGFNDTAIFDTASISLSIGLVQVNTVQAVQVRDDTVVFDMKGLMFNATVASPGAGLMVGHPTATTSSATFGSSQPGGRYITEDILVQAAPLGTASLTITDANFSLDQIITGQVTVGDNIGGGSSSLAINNQATLNSGVGGFTVNASGSVSVASNATFNANGDILIDGGSITGLTSNSVFNWAVGKTFTVQNGGSVTGSFNSQYDSPAGSSWVVTGVGSTVSGAGNQFDLTGASSIDVNNGGAWTKSFSVKGGSTVTADGAVSGATLGGFDIVDGSVTLANGATASSSFFDIGDFVSGGLGTGTLNIQSGSSVTTNLSNGLQISSSTSDTNGVVNVTGAGSALNVVSTIIGGTSGSTGTLNLSSGGAYNSSAATRLNPTGTLNVNSGSSLNADANLVFAGGTLNVTSGGTLDTTGQVVVQDGLLDIQQSATFNLNNNLFVNGGTFRKDRLATMTMGNGVNITISDNGLAEFTSLFSNFSVNNANIVAVDGFNDGAGTPSELHAFGDLSVSGGSLVNITNNGVLTVDDQLNVNALGVLQLGSNGVLNANGNILVNGGTLLGLSSFTAFNWAAGKTFTVQNGGGVSSFSVSYTSPANSRFIVTGAGSSVSGAGNTFRLDGTSSIDVSNGGAWTKNIDILGGSTVTADGAGSTLGTFDIIDGSVTLTNGAAASSSLFNVGDFGSGTGTLNVRSGSTLTSFNSFGVSLGNSDSDGEVFIDGNGSSVQTVLATIGSNLAGTGLVDVSNGGSFIVTGTSALRATGTININGGTVLLGNAADLSGTINFNSGTFGTSGDLTVGAAGMFGANVTTGARSYVFGGTVTVEPGASLTMSGGKLSAGSLQNFGTFAFNSGTLELTSDNLEVDFGGLLGRTPTVAAGQNVIVTNSVNVSSVGLLTIDGGSVTAGTLNNGGIVQMNSLAALIDGGTLVNTGTLTGTGLIDSTLSNGAGGEVRVGLGESMVFNGTGNTNAGLIDNLGGSLQFNGGLTNNVGGVITSRGPLRLLGGLTNDGNLSSGAGTNDVFGSITNSATGQVSVAGGSTTSFFGALVNSGDVFVGFDSRASFFNAVSGAGTFSGTGVVEFAGGFSPGASPATVSFGGDVILAGSASLLIELGGLNAGAEYDQLAIAGDATIGGTLDITTLGGFVPSPGMAFDIITFGGSLTGSFGNVVNSTGLAGLILNVTSDADSVNLLLDALAGDLNVDGFVGIADLNIVLGRWNQNVTAGIWQLGDPSNDGFVGIADLNAVLGNWNAGTPPGAPTAEAGSSVPEPGALVLSSLSGLLLMARSRRARLA